MSVKLSFEDAVKSDVPLVFDNAIQAWPARKWTVKTLADILNDRKVRCKISLIDSTGKWLYSNTT